MSALCAMASKCVKLRETDAPDGAGGFTRTFTEEPPFDAVIVRGKFGEDRAGQKASEAAAFTVIVERDAGLSFHDVFKRLSDGAVFRMTSTAGDCAAPDVASVPIAKGKCERWALP